MSLCNTHQLSISRLCSIQLMMYLMFYLSPPTITPYFFLVFYFVALHRPIPSTLSLVHLKLWDLSAGRLLAELPGHTGPVTAVAFHPTVLLLATASADRTVRLFDLENFTQIAMSGTELNASVIRRIAFHPDGVCLYVANIDYLKVSPGWSVILNRIRPLGEIRGCLQCQLQSGLVPQKLSLTHSVDVWIYACLYHRSSIHLSRHHTVLIFTRILSSISLSLYEFVQTGF